jgi:putative transcriptional regulator
MNIEKITKAIEADAGEPLPDLRQALEEAKVREASGMSQSTFAERIGTPVATL